MKGNRISYGFVAEKPPEFFPRQAKDNKYALYLWQVFKLTSRINPLISNSICFLITISFNVLSTYKFQKNSVENRNCNSKVKHSQEKHPGVAFAHFFTQALP
jgi:hypothetical protein